MSMKDYIRSNISFSIPVLIPWTFLSGLADVINLLPFELPKTIHRILDGGPPLLNNSEHPAVSVVAIAKRPLPAGYQIERGIGSFDVRGIAIQIRDDPDHVPIGLLADAVVKNSIEPGQRIRFQDVDLPDSVALVAWRTICDKVLLSTS